MDLLTTRNYLKQEKNIIIHELISSDQLKDGAHIDDAIVISSGQLEQIAQRILDHLMEEPQDDQPEEVSACDE